MKKLLTCLFVLIGSFSFGQELDWVTDRPEIDRFIFRADNYFDKEDYKAAAKNYEKVYLYTSYKKNRAYSASRLAECWVKRGDGRLACELLKETLDRYYVYLNFSDFMTTFNNAAIVLETEKRYYLFSQKEKAKEYHDYIIKVAPYSSAAAESLYRLIQMMVGDDKSIHNLGHDEFELMEDRIDAFLTRFPNHTYSEEIMFLGVEVFSERILRSSFDEEAVTRYRHYRNEFERKYPESDRMKKIVKIDRAIYVEAAKYFAYLGYFYLLPAQERAEAAKRYLEIQRSQYAGTHYDRATEILYSIVEPKPEAKEAE